MKKSTVAIESLTHYLNVVIALRSLANVYAAARELGWDGQDRVELFEILHQAHKEIGSPNLMENGPPFLN